MIKTKKELIEEASKYLKTKMTLTPTNQRIFCTDFDPGVTVRESGIITPGQMTKVDKAGDIQKMPRFVVQAAAGDAIIKDEKGEDYLLKRGDEIYPFLPMDAIGRSLEAVFDYGNGEVYFTFHVTELAGFIKS
jgi:hypothetical protein